MSSTGVPCFMFYVNALSMSTKFGPAGIPGTRLKVCGGWWWVQTSYHVTPVQDLELNA